MSVLIIAEAGVNHNGSLLLAKQLVDAAAKAKVDYIKFQTFNSKKLASASASQADYQRKNIGKQENQLKMLQKLELSQKDHFELIEYCKSKGVKFLSSAFDLESIDFLKSLSLDLWKIPSGEINNLPYLEKIGSFNESVVMSTGMCNTDEIQAAIDVLRKAGTPNKKITILHCNTEYPTPFIDVNLKAMLTIKSHFNLDVGYSDHTIGIEVPIAAVALGAQVIEKHFTLDKTLPGPDHKASLEPGELTDMVSGIRNIELALGDGAKKPSASEAKNIVIARKSIHLARSLKIGSAIDENDLVMKRPGDGISPMEFYQVVGKKVKQDLDADYKLSWEDLL